jgi:hypothetical protein
MLPDLGGAIYGETAMRCFTMILALGLVAAASSVVWAHQPLLSDGSARDASTALYIADVDLSQVVYHEVTAESPLLWLAFDLNEGQSLYFQLGVPVIERLKDYRPALVLVGPGLPQVDLPFAIPDGLGAQPFTSEQVAEPQRFDEPFSGTSSWILLTETVPVPATGRYYLVAYDPAGQPGKLWVTLGQREEFGLGDIAALQDILPKVREFHEIGAAPVGLPCFLAPTALALTAFCFWSASRRLPPAGHSVGR